MANKRTLDVKGDFIYDMHINGDPTSVGCTVDIFRSPKTRSKACAWTTHLQGVKVLWNEEGTIVEGVNDPELREAISHDINGICVAYMSQFVGQPADALSELGRRLDTVRSRVELAFKDVAKIQILNELESARDFADRMSDFFSDDEDEEDSEDEKREQNTPVYSKSEIEEQIRRLQAKLADMEDEGEDGEAKDEVEDFDPRNIRHERVLLSCLFLLLQHGLSQKPNAKICAVRSEQLLQGIRATWNSKEVASISGEHVGKPFGPPLSIKELDAAIAWLKAVCKKPEDYPFSGWRFRGHDGVNPKIPEDHYGFVRVDKTASAPTLEDFMFQVEALATTVGMAQEEEVEEDDDSPFSFDATSDHNNCVLLMVMLRVFYEHSVKEGQAIRKISISAKNLLKRVRELWGSTDVLADSQTLGLTVSPIPSAPVGSHQLEQAMHNIGRLAGMYDVPPMSSWNLEIQQGVEKTYLMTTANERKCLMQYDLEFAQLKTFVAKVLGISPEIH